MHTLPHQHPDWEQIVRDTAERARQSLPEADSRIDDALLLVLGNHVTLHSDGHSGMVQSQSDPSKAYSVNGECLCPDSVHRAPKGLCKHRLALYVYRSALKALPMMTVPPATPVAPAEPARTVPADGVVVIHGKEHITYKALLAMAHAAGLKSLKARFVSVDKELAVAEAEAIFADGRIFTEASDATPQNVGPQVRPHFARMSLTRAKARCLRDALNIGTCAVEELGE